MNLDEIRIIDGSNDAFELIKDLIERRDQEDAFYLLDVGDVIKKHKSWRSKMPRVEPHFAMKCNPDPTVVRTLAALNASFDCASKHEIEQILSIGVPSKRIIFANAVKLHSHIQFARKVGVNLLTVDSEFELYKIKSIFPEAKIVIRFRCDSTSATTTLGTKCGCDSVNDAPKIMRKAKSLGLDVHGFSFHVGTPCDDTTAYIRGINISLDLIDYAISLGFEHVKLIDIGGGFPGRKDDSLDEINRWELSVVECFCVRESVCIEPDYNSLFNVPRNRLFIKYLFMDYFKFSEAINKVLNNIDPSIRVISEPGRYYVDSAFTLASLVYGKKKVEEENGARYMYYINDGTYGSFIEAMLNVTIRIPRPLKKPASEVTHPSTFWGPTCDSYDCVVPDCDFPELNIGDWLVWSDMGAYTVSLAKNFNGFFPSRVFPYIIRKEWDSLLNELATQKNEILSGIK